MLLALLAALPSTCSTPVCTIDTLHVTLTQVARTRSRVEADEALTMAYVKFELAWAFARVGANEKSAALVSAAQAALPQGDVVHRWLMDVYAWRITNAKAPLGEPLPPELDARLNSMLQFDRYKVDRFRAQSTVLEGQERLEPISAFFRTGLSDAGVVDPRGASLSELRGEAADGRLEPELRAAVQDSIDPLVLGGAIELSLRLKPDRSVAFIEVVLGRLATVPVADRTRILTTALKSRALPGRQHARFEHGEKKVVARLVSELDAAARLVENDQPELFADAAEAMARATVTFGAQPSDAARLERLSRLANRADAGPSGPLLNAVLAFVQATQGATPLAKAALEASLRGLDVSVTPLPKDRLRLVRAIAWASTAMPAQRKDIVQRLLAQWPGTTDSFSTNSHACISVVSFVDSLVLALTVDTPLR